MQTNEVGSGIVSEQHYHLENFIFCVGMLVMIVFIAVSLFLFWPYCLYVPRLGGSRTREFFGWFFVVLWWLVLVAVLMLFFF